MNIEQAKATIGRITGSEDPPLSLPLWTILEQMRDICAGIDDCRITLDDHADRVLGSIATAEKVEIATDSRDLPLLYQIYGELDALRYSIRMLREATARNTGLA